MCTHSQILQFRREGDAQSNNRAFLHWECYFLKHDNVEKLL